MTAPNLRLAAAPNFRLAAATDHCPPITMATTNSRAQPKATKKQHSSAQPQQVPTTANNRKRIKRKFFYKFLIALYFYSILFFFTWQRNLKKYIFIHIFRGDIIHFCCTRHYNIGHVNKGPKLLIIHRRMSLPFAQYINSDKKTYHRH